MAKHSEIRSRMATPWWVRKAVYASAAVIGLALVALNIVEPATVDAWSEQIAPLVSVLVAGVGGLAALRTGADSDNFRPVVDADDVVEAVVHATAERVSEAFPNLPVYTGLSSVAE